MEELTRYRKYYQIDKTCSNCEAIYKGNKKCKKTPKCQSCRCHLSKSGELNPRWKGGCRYWSEGRWGRDNEGLSWKIQRRLAWKRANGKCELCGKTEQENGRKLDTDHKIPWMTSRSHSLDNLWCLCKKCHGKEESKRPESEGIKQYLYKKPIIPRCENCNGKKRKIYKNNLCCTCWRECYAIPIVKKLAQEGIYLHKELAIMFGVSNPTISVWLNKK